MNNPTTIDIEEVKSILGYKNNKHDEYLSVMMPLIFDHVTAHCNNNFTSKSGELIVPGGVRLFVAKACEHNMQNVGLKSRSMGSVSYSYELEFPETFYKYIRPYKRLRFHASR